MLKLLRTIYNNNIIVKDYDRENKSIEFTRELKPAEVNILAYLIVMSKDGKCVASYADIARHCRISVRAAKDRVATLINNRILRKDVKVGYKNTYEIVREKLIK